MLGIVHRLYLDFILFQMQIIEDEISIWAGLEHQYVLSFYGTVKYFGRFGSRAFVSPWMPNGNLNSYLNREDVSLTEMDRLILVSFVYKVRYKSLPCYSQLIQITEGLKYCEQ